MSSTERDDLDDIVASCYNKQKRLKEEDKLLARDPGEMDTKEVPAPGILDISMED
jgi:hypothetical protein